MTLLSGNARATPVDDPNLLDESDFSTGTQGWTQIMNGNQPLGVIGLDTEITYRGSPYSLLGSTEDYNDQASNLPQPSWASVLLLKRLALGHTAGVIRQTMVWAYGSTWGQDTPRVIEFGLDRCAPDTSRYFPKVRYEIHDGTQRTRKYKLLVDDGSGGEVYVDVPGGDYIHGWNENKRNMWKVEFDFDFTTGHYVGLRLNSTDGFGTLADVPDTSLYDLGPALLKSLPTFEGGFNPMINLRNRNNVSGGKSRAWVNLCYSRTERVG